MLGGFVAKAAAVLSKAPLNFEKKYSLGSIKMVIGYFPWPPPTGILVTAEAEIGFQVKPVKRDGGIALQFAMSGEVTVGLRYALGLDFKGLAMGSGFSGPNIDVRNKTAVDAKMFEGMNLKKLATGKGVEDFERDRESGVLSIKGSVIGGVIVGKGTATFPILKWEFGKDVAWFGTPNFSIQFGPSPAGVIFEVAGSAELESTFTTDRLI